MRERPDVWTGNERICWLCALMEHFVRVSSLAHAPALMSGLWSVANAPILEDARLAIYNLRQLTLNYTTLQSIKHAVGLYNDHHFRMQTVGAYRIQPELLSFHRTTDLEDVRIAKARAWLSRPVALARHGARPADPAQAMSVELGEDALSRVQVPVDLSRVTLLPRRLHDAERAPVHLPPVPWTELRRIAGEMDARDAANPGRRPGNWLGRFENLLLMVPQAGAGLRESSELHLCDTQHLIGLPGAGKTTLLMLLAVWLGHRGHRTMMIFPSIEVARQYLADLRFHGVRTGMLVGQNPTTRRRHADNVAESIAAIGGQGGFATTVEGADLFAANCVLPAFSNEDKALWGFGQAPCEEILQGRTRKGEPKERLCPVWTQCGRNRAPRELLDAEVWVGHVASMDTRVPKHATEETIRYFELIARSFDLVIFDEADMVQSYLDGYGAALMSLSGSEASIHQQLQEQIHSRFARGENHRLHDRTIELFSRELAEFGNHNTSMITTVHNLEDKVRDRFADQLLTTWRVISELLEGFDGRPSRRDDADDAEVLQGHNRARALTSLWDTAAYEAFYDRTGFQSPVWPRAELCSTALGISAEELEASRQELVRQFRRYLAEMLIDRRDEIISGITRAFLAIGFRDRSRPDGVDHAVRLLVAVTFMILGYQRIVPATRTLVAEELIREPVAPGTASSEMRRFIPENILGSLSGVKYTFLETRTTRRGRNVELHYVAFVGAPRMLMHRFSRLLEAEGRPGPAVLLASATSYLRASPAYHVSVGPHYLLRSRVERRIETRSVFRFKPIPDRQRGDAPLRYSGAGDLADRNLLRMVDALCKGERDRTEVYKAIRGFDRRGDAQRKAAFVVNSYAQARAIKRHLDDHHREIGRRTKAVVSWLREGERPADYVTPAQVEAVGDDSTCDLLVFPMGAIGRGVNIVFTGGPRTRDAAISTMYFLTRPHPSRDDMQLLLSLAGRASQDFDERIFEADTDLDALHSAWQEARFQARSLARRLLQEPLMASRLGRRLFRPFTANQMVMILQTLGRGMRNGCPVQVNFVDAAWAPLSAKGRADNARTSMLVQMRVLLEEAVRDPDPVVRAIYQELYGAFLEPLRAVDGLVIEDEGVADGSDEEDAVEEFDTDDSGWE